MEVRYSIHPEQARTFDTQKLRKEFLITDLFAPDRASLTYSYSDRVIVGGVLPLDKSVVLEGGKEIAAEYFLKRREMGIINIGGEGTVETGESAYTLGFRDGLYLGMGTREVSFSSVAKKEPAKFYLVSAPAFQSNPSRIVTLDQARKIELGSHEQSNRRTIHQYIHPDIMESNQLVVGLTLLEPANIWNTMPVHTHGRRMEVYFYFDLPEENVVFHLMGEPDETRHLVVRNEQAVISPSWSIHGGAGTTNYSFIWAMAGENQDFTDMDGVSLTNLK